MATVIIDRGNDAKMRNNPSIDGLIYFNTDDNCIYLDDGTNKTIYGGRIPMLTSVTSDDGAANNNVYSAQAAKNGFCLKSNVADTANNINNTSNNGRPVGCVGFKSVIGTSSISDVGTNVKNAINNLHNRLVVNDSTFYFDYQDGKWGFNTSSNRGADTFHPFNSTTLTINDNEIDATEAYLRVSATTDTSTTALPIDMTDGTCAVTVVNGYDLKVSSNKFVNGGVIHVFNDLGHGTSGGTHAHYILLDGAWRITPNKTPFDSNANAVLGLPFSVPNTSSRYDTPTGKTYYGRFDNLYYYVCTDNMVKIYKYDTTNVEYYDKGQWTELVNQRYTLTDDSNISNYSIGGYNHMTVYNGSLHLIGGSYQVNDETYSDNNHYIWSASQQTWTKTPIVWLSDSEISGIRKVITYGNKIRVFYFRIVELTYKRYIYQCYRDWSNNTWSDEHTYGFYKSGDTSTAFPIDGETEFVVYNGQIHMLGGYVNPSGTSITTQHIKLASSGDTSYYTYAALKYPFRNAMACVAPPINLVNRSASDLRLEPYLSSYDEAKGTAPTYIHYLGTSQANPSSGNYRKKHQQIQDTYVGVIENTSTLTFI